MAFIPWFPLASGSDGFFKRVQAIALAWLLRRSDNILLIPKTKSIQHLHDNNAAIKVERSDNEFHSLTKMI